MLDLKKILDEKGLTQTDLADKLGITKGTLSSNLKNPKLETIQKIAAALNLEVADLFPKSNPDNTQELFTKDENGNLKSVGFLKR